MRIIILKNCDTCRKAVKALEAAGYQLEIVDIRGEGISGRDLDQISTELGSAAVNTRSTTWRGLSQEARQAAPRDLIAANPTVMKRPVIIAEDGTLTSGWSAEVQARWL